jgi:hypothetical protein
MIRKKRTFPRIALSYFPISIFKSQMVIRKKSTFPTHNMYLYYPISIFKSQSGDKKNQISLFIRNIKGKLFNVHITLLAETQLNTNTNGSKKERMVALRPHKPKHIRGSWSHYTDTSKPDDGYGAQNMVTVQSRCRTQHANCAKWAHQQIERGIWISRPRKCDKDRKTLCLHISCPYTINIHKMG